MQRQKFATTSKVTKSSKHQVQTQVDYERQDLIPEDEPFADGEEERRFPSP